MAIISIPSSIGGVTIPGAAIDGPLGALFGKGGNKVLQYPRDLQSSTRGHVVKFTIKKVDPVHYDEEKYGIDYQKDTIIRAGEKVVGALTDITKNITGQQSDSMQKKGLNFQPSRKNIQSYIFLYMPDTVNFQYNSSYHDESVLAAAGKFLNSLPGQSEQEKNKKRKKMTASQKRMDMGLSVVSNAVENFGSLGLSKAGYAVNPQMQLLFQGIGFREYQMVFTFTPYSKQEAETVKNIINTFKEHSLPTQTTSLGGMFFVPPSTFTPEFLYNGATNPNINKVTDSVITGIDVNYSPNGWSAYDDGAPVQTILTLQFKEIVLVDSDMVKKGY